MLKANKSDPDNILCAESNPIRSENIDQLTERQLDEVFEDFYQFSCSFVDKKARELTKKPIAYCAIDFDALERFYQRVRDEIKNNTDDQ